MNTVICKWAFRDAAAWFGPIVALILIYYIIYPAPFLPISIASLGLGALLGFAVAFRIFWDGGGVRPFLFSRAFAPTRLFLVRWAFGIFLIALVWTTCSLIFATGIRQLAQVVIFKSGWYPMIRLYELETLVPFIATSLFSYQTTVLFVLRHRYFRRSRLSWLAWFFRGFIALFVTIVLGICVFGFFVCCYESEQSNMDVTPALMLGPIIIAALCQTLVVPFAGYDIYSNMEIES
ncbi:MAG: hypothetical protein ACRCUY_13995 [Thermoguttaceae bacterium]